MKKALSIHGFGRFRKKVEKPAAFRVTETNSHPPNPIAFSCCKSVLLPTGEGSSSTAVRTFPRVSNFLYSHFGMSSLLMLLMITGERTKAGFSFYEVMVGGHRLELWTSCL